MFIVQLALALLLALSISTSPAAPPSTQSWNAAKAYHESFGGQALLIMHNGKIIRESYRHGGGPDHLQILASGSKSFVGLAAIAAVEDGYLKLDDRACESLTEWKSDPQKRQITYRQLLTLTSGLTPGEIGAATRSPSWQEIVDKPLVAKPGERFEYGAYQLCAFSEALQRILKAKTGQSFESYLKERLLEPMDIKVTWRIRCADGNPQVGGGAAMTARDWARLGECMLNKGKIDGKQILSPASIDQLLTGTQQNPTYGLTWWMREPVSRKLQREIPILARDMGEIANSTTLPDDLFMAAGAGKQRLYIIPSLHLVIVRLADIREGMHFKDVEFLEKILN